MLFDTPQASAATRTVPPGTSITAGLFLGRPSRLPCALALCSPAINPFPNPLSLELGQGREDMQLELASRCRAVDPFPKTDERDFQRGQFLDQRHKVLE